MTCTLVFGLITYVMMSQITPRYTARSSVMLDPRSVQVLSSDNVVSDLKLNNPLLDTEVAVLRSNLLLEAVLAQMPADRLDRFDPANRPLSVIDGVKKSVKSGVAGIKNALTVGPDDAASTADLLDPEARRLRRLVGSLRQSMQVWREGQSYLISISVETQDPVLSTLFANTVVETYIARQIEDRKNVIRGATQFLEQRVNVLRADVEKTAAAVESFRYDQIASSGLSPATLEKQLLELSTQLALANADFSQTEAGYNQILSVIETAGLTAAAELLSSPLVLSLRQELSEKARENADMATRFSIGHPDRVRLELEIDLLEKELAEEVRKILASMRNDVEVARIRSRSIQTSVSALESQSAEMSRTNIELRQLEREAESARENFQGMLNRLNETRSTEQLQRADARQVERAVVPGAASAPRSLLFTVFGSTLGLSFGLILTFVLLVAGRGFNRASQIEQATGLPVLATLLRGSWRNNRAMLTALQNQPYQNFSERLRQLRNTLSVSQGGAAKGQCVLVTSAVPNEAKTSTVLALAYLEALAGRKCVVLDFDLRKSQMAQEFGYDSDVDLSDVLIGGAPVVDAVYTPPDLDFGIVTLKSPDPKLIDLASPDRLQQVLDDLKSTYDLVLIDTAPILLVSDTLKLPRLVDHLLLLVRAEKTRRRAVTEAARWIEDLGSKSAAAVMTLSDPKSDRESYGLASDYGYVS